MSQQKVIIIGAGVAGVASAIRLAVQGFVVDVYEKNACPGGKLSHFEIDSFQFDAGPSLFTQPQNIEALFELANEPIADYFTYTSIPIACKYFFDDGVIVNAYTNSTLFANELQEKLGEDANNVTSYLQESKKMYQSIGTIFLNYSLHKISTLFKAPICKALIAIKPKYLFKTLHSLNQKSFTKSHTVQLFNRFATYNGSSPYKAPGMLSLIPHLEHNEGVFYPNGGMISITNALYKLAIKKGVKFHFNSPVISIIQHDDTAKGIVVGNENHCADIVVSNMDAYFTYKNLLNNHRKAKRILKQERSSSALIFYWGINQQFTQLELHNIFFTANYQAEFDSLFKTKSLYTDPTIYVNITSKCEPNVQAPAGKENWFVMVNAPANVGQDWEAFAAQYRQVIIAKLNRLLQTNIEPLIQVEQILDPVLIESKTASYMGSLYGTSSNSKLAAFLRHPNFTNSTKGLYFVGGSVHPGGGIPLCLQSAKIMSDIVAEDMKKKQKKPH